VTLAGNIYGVVLNDEPERAALAPQFEEKPYAAPPRAPVVYMKPLSSVATGPVAVPPGGLTAAATLALLVARDTGRVAAADVISHPGGAAPVLDRSRPASSYYRPAVAQKNADGRIALGSFATPALPKVIRLLADGTVIHEWSLDRLHRQPDALVADLGAFLTLKAGDLLMIGLPGDAPLVQAGQTLRVEAEGLPPLDVATTGEVL
jgi:5-oxopent-3-ene-1,2,5-tricarboxylate decarboxylase/2-hydroxyhepta-2,4-diene-1,7-dioate isomerase